MKLSNVVWGVKGKFVHLNSSQEENNGAVWGDRGEKTSSSKSKG